MHLGGEAFRFDVHIFGLVCVGMYMACEDGSPAWCWGMCGKYTLAFLCGFDDYSKLGE